MTPEEIAREAAEALIHVGPYGSQGGHTLYGSLARVLNSLPTGDETFCRERASRYHDVLIPAILAAVERALREVPVDGGLSDERLAEMRARVEEYRRGRSGCLLNVVDALFPHIDHLTRLLQDAAADGVLTRTQEVRDAAFRAGAEAQREADLAAAEKINDEWRGFGSSGSSVVSAIRRLPLAGPPV